VCECVTNVNVTRHICVISDWHFTELDGQGLCTVHRVCIVLKSDDVCVAFHSRLSSADRDDMFVPRSRTACYGPCSFHVAAPLKQKFSEALPMSRLTQRAKSYVASSSQEQKH